MRSGHSYITLTEKNKKHVLVRALIEKGVTKLTLIYASHLSTNAGWDLVEHDGQFKYFSGWLGYTKKEALEKIKELTP